MRFVLDKVHPNHQSGVYAWIVVDRIKSIFLGGAVAFVVFTIALAFAR